ncbi:MAG: hypothetical protein A2832_01235 [Candidatus Zambryskibacteria bacterium RIFCSPHIGHO2_01_FULL_44_22b]|uniref:Penicillin-binding protein 2 n=2 Tax=Candidatus Zambryskiibacteriota TaxID=1817925 RepID=A0A1G2SX93_9BACT|nr:MAG: hypothetical protein A2832_01235 [Candidatus Zambryskibacteria bacterium RIFCSPHIGHO2_01_FULL_44_22b]OHB04889.1 MAG: hypothetical protein A3B16_01610 [Candidatus Zambryskibacteria bacterium RIFCSPLOWO2_01_FULL_45_43]
MFIKLGKFKRRPSYQNINPEDVFIDSENLPGFESSRFEGRLEKPMSHGLFIFMKGSLLIIALILVSKLWILSVRQGPVYTQISENNRLEQTLVFANRGVIYDRNKVELATNVIKVEGRDFPARFYASISGIAHVVGYLKYPMVDKNGFYYETDYRGRDGAERAYDEYLRGANGLKLKETDVFGEVTSEAIIEKPVDGGELILSIDAHLSEALYKAIENLAHKSSFVGGAGVVMDVRTGEILALVSYPEYDENLLTEGSRQPAINALIQSSSKPFLNRAIAGLYTPGSIVKPIVATAALNEEIISPAKKILSTGQISVPNPYDRSKPTIFKDWKAHGWTDMKEALAVSSDTYFYSIGGGFGDQKGLGITLLDEYFRIFGLTEKTGIELLGELEGVIPTPEWKAKHFDGDIWRLGDTYITAIGQYGTEITPLNAARFTAAIANGGKILKPSIILGGVESPVERSINFRDEDWKIVREGMRAGVSGPGGTSAGLNVPYVKVAAKTGTAEVGSNKKYVNSWSIGFFPYDEPKYAWAVVMERGPASNTIGATSVTRQLFDWIAVYNPKYFE